MPATQIPVKSKRSDPGPQPRATAKQLGPSADARLSSRTITRARQNPHRAAAKPALLSSSHTADADRASELTAALAEDPAAEVDAISSRPPSSSQPIEFSSHVSYTTTDVVQPEQSGSGDEAEYEDDFEEYEDDFEDEDDPDHDAEDDSGDAPAAMSAAQRHRHRLEVEAVRLAIQRENAQPFSSDSAQQPLRQLDQNTNAEADAENPIRQQGGGFINFLAANEEQKQQMTAGLVQKRGRHLLTMIRLDISAFDLLDMSPVKYDQFMKYFGTSNMRQEYCQTTEDDMAQEIQTDSIAMLHKWTQNPPAALAIQPDDHDYKVFLQSVRGVGGDDALLRTGQRKPWLESAEVAEVPAHREPRLVRFLGTACQALLALLEEQSDHRDHGGDGQLPPTAFSDKTMLLSVQQFPFLLNRPVVKLAFAPDLSHLLLTAHDAPPQAELDARSFICIWNLTQPSRPVQVLTAGQRITAAGFGPYKATLAVAGFLDGSICVWDLREAAHHHREVSQRHDSEVVPRAATFIAPACDNLEAPVHYRHTSPVVGIVALARASSQSDDGDASGVFQLLSLEKHGRLIVWTVLDGEHDPSHHLGLAHWGRIRLACSSVIDVCGPNDGVPVTLDVCSAPLDASKVLVATDQGQVWHGSTHQGHRPNPRHYTPELDECGGVACRSLDFCPFGEPLLLAASDDGSVRLHSVNSRHKPLISWPGTVDGQPAVQVLWSRSRPCVFFVRDSMSRIHVWDLELGDLLPAHSVQCPGRVNAMALSPEQPYLALAMQDGTVEVHQLRPELQGKPEPDRQHELRKLRQFVCML